jgi:outer membrane protein TolC
MKKIVLLLGVGFLVLSASAQNTDTTHYSFSVQQAINYALENQRDVKNAIIDEDVADYKIKETRGVGLPHVNGSVDLKDFIQIPTQVLPPGTPIFGGPGLPGYATFKFGTNYSALAGINWSQLLFNNDFFLGLRAANLYEELTQKSTTRTKIETQAAVSKAYYNALITTERAKLMDANVARLKKAMEDTKVLWDNGFAEKIEYDRLNVTYNNLLVQQNQLVRLMEVSVYLLKYQMGMPIITNLTLTDKLEDLQFDSHVNPEIEKFDYNKRVEYKLAEMQYGLTELDFKRNKWAWLPTLNLYGLVGTNWYRQSFEIYQVRWYPNIFVGATLNVPLFNGLQGHARMEQAKLKLTQSSNNFDFVKKSIDLELATSATNLRNAAALLEDKKQFITVAEDVVRISKLKYEQGVGTNLELVSDETALLEAQTNYYNALYDAIIAKIDYDKASGNLK